MAVRVYDTCDCGKTVETILPTKAIDKDYSAKKVWCSNCGSIVPCERSETV